MRPILLLLTITCLTTRLHSSHIIQVLDDQSNRGVPMVELETVNHIKLVTDSNGVLVFDEPGLMDTDVWFSIKSHGYEYPADGFGSRGKTILTKDGAKTTLKIKRVNIAERLYRITGQGIYGESLKAGMKVPIDQPALNAQVLGQDSVQLITYQDKLYWFWGDTEKASYTLGHFGTAGATSELPGKGGLDPAIGVNLRYFVDKTGFSRPMVDIPQEGLKWIDGLIVIKDPSGNERLIAKCQRMKDLGTMLERDLIQFDDQKQAFVKLKELDKDGALFPAGQTFRYTDDGVEYIYFPWPYATMRVRADWNAILDPHQYEAFTPLKPGTRYTKEKSQLDHIWAWKKDTDPIRETEQKELIDKGMLKPQEAWFDMKDAATGKKILAHGGSIEWNPWRKKWIMIFVEFGGSSSLLGEVWYSESDAPHGPFRKAIKIATHDKQTFYNPVHHPEFDQQGGRVIYFEGTYCNTFSGNPEQTPRYDYNQIMYRLDLADARLQMDR